jgi:CheY-like chemotaxis protein
MTSTTPTLLVIEDNEDDVFLLRRTLRSLPDELTVVLAQDGQEALDYVAGTGKFANRARYPLPDTILLDLKLPYVHGFEVLAAIRVAPAWKDVPVIVLTSSGEDRDQERTAAFGVRHYHLKPPTPALLADIATVLAGRSAAPAT